MKLNKPIMEKSLKRKISGEKIKSNPIIDSKVIN